MKFIKIEMEKGRTKKENKQLKQGFRNNIEIWRKGLETLLGEILTTHAFVMLQIRWSKH